MTNDTRPAVAPLNPAWRALDAAIRRFGVEHVARELGNGPFVLRRAIDNYGSLDTPRCPTCNRKPDSAN